MFCGKSAMHAALYPWVREWPETWSSRSPHLHARATPKVRPPDLKPCGGFLSKKSIYCHRKIRAWILILTVSHDPAVSERTACRVPEKARGYPTALPQHDLELQLQAQYKTQNPTCHASWILCDDNTTLETMFLEDMMGPYSTSESLRTQYEPHK